MFTISLNNEQLFRQAAQTALRRNHLQGLEQLLRIIREEAAATFSEDNSATINSFIIELLDKSNPYPDTPYYNEAGRKLLEEHNAEITRLRGVLNMAAEDYTHQCRACDQRYNPEGYPSEDCPRCGSDGTLR